jgi:hypothetical protein
VTGTVAKPNRKEQTMRTALNKAGAAYTAVGLFIVAALAYGVDPTPESIVTTGASGLVTSVLNVAQGTWPIWVPVVAVMIGIRLFRKIAHA